MRKLLLVEDEEILRETYTMILSTEPYDLYVATNGAQALKYCNQHTFDIILLDLMMPIKNGVDFLREYTGASYPETKIIIISNLSAGDMLQDALSLGAYKNVVKSDLSPKELLSMVRYEMDATESDEFINA